jgi:hypothetical protein
LDFVLGGFALGLGFALEALAFDGAGLVLARDLVADLAPDLEDPLATPLARALVSPERTALATVFAVVFAGRGFLPWAGFVFDAGLDFFDFFADAGFVSGAALIPGSPAAGFSPSALSGSPMASKRRSRTASMRVSWDTFKPNISLT